MVESGKSFADEFFDRGEFLGAPRVRFGDEWAEAFREGDVVFVEHGGKRYRVVSRSGYWDSGVVEIREVAA